MFLMSLLDTFKYFSFVNISMVRGFEDESCHNWVRSQSLMSRSLRYSVCRKSFEEIDSSGFPPRLSCKRETLS